MQPANGAGGATARQGKGKGMAALKVQSSEEDARDSDSVRRTPRIWIPVRNTSTRGREAVRPSLFVAKGSSRLDAMMIRFATAMIRISNPLVPRQGARPACYQLVPSKRRPPSGPTPTHRVSQSIRMTCIQARATHSEGCLPKPRGRKQQAPNLSPTSMLTMVNTPAQSQPRDADALTSSQFPTRTLEAACSGIMAM